MTDSRTTRRAFLGAAAAGSVAVFGGRGLRNGSANTGDAAGQLVFTYDDGSVEDYTEAFEKAHEPEGVPACTAIPSARVGSAGSLDADQIDEMTAAGWEVASHTVHHRALTSIGLTRDVTPGDERVYVASNLHGKLAGDRIELFDGTNAEVATVAGRGEDERGQYVRLDDSIDRAYAVADGARERYTDAVVRAALRDSRDQLERELGVEVTNLVVPYGGYGEQPRRMVGDYYTAVANAGGYANGDEGLNPIGDLDLPHLSRRYFREGEMTRPEIRSFLDRVADEDVVGILGGHTWRTETLPAERIRWTIREAKDRDVEVVTLRQALADRGGSGTTTDTSTGTTTDSTTADTTTTETTTRTTDSTTTEPTTAEPTTTETTTTETTTTVDSTTTETTTEITTTETTTADDPTTTRTTTTTETTTTDSTTTRTTTSDPPPAETTTETTTRTTSETTVDTTTTDTTIAESTTTGSGGSNGGGTGGTGGTGNPGGSPSTSTTESTTAGATTTEPTATGQAATTETTTETTNRMAVRDDGSRTATKAPPARTTTPTRTTPTRTSTTTGASDATGTADATGAATRTGLETTSESTAAATDSPGVDWDALGWVAALGGTGSIAAYLATRASGVGDDE